MSITNISKPTTSLANSSKVSHQETWDSNTTSWDTETRTWDEMETKVSNTTRVSSSITNTNKP